MSTEQLIHFVAMGMIAVSLGVVSWLAIIMVNEQAQGAMIGVLTAGVGWALRGRVEKV